MASFNKVILCGNLTRDPEKRYIPSGTAVADLSLAVNERFKGRDGEWQESAVYIDVEVWDRQAETCAQYLHKGSPVLIEGRLKLDQWETKEGDKRSKLRVRAERVQFLGARGESGSSSSTGGSASSDAGYSEQRAPSQSAPAPSAPPASADEDDDLPF